MWSLETLYRNFIYIFFRSLVHVFTVVVLLLCVMCAGFPYCGVSLPVVCALSLLSLLRLDFPDVLGLFGSDAFPIVRGIRGDARLGVRGGPHIHIIIFL